MPHEPQLFSSVLRYTQDPLHDVCVVYGHEHLPFRQYNPTPHTVPQAPQLDLSVDVFVQAPLHRFGVSVGHVQLPATQP